MSCTPYARMGGEGEDGEVLGHFLEGFSTGVWVDRFFSEQLLISGQRVGLDICGFLAAVLAAYAAARSRALIHGALRLS